MRPHRRYRDGDMSMLAYLPIVGVSAADSNAALEGAATLIERALLISVVRPL